MKNNKQIQSAEEERVTGDLCYGSHKIILQHIFTMILLIIFPPPAFTFFQEENEFDLYCYCCKY